MEKKTCCNIRYVSTTEKLIAVRLQPFEDAFSSIMESISHIKLSVNQIFEVSFVDLNLFKGATQIKLRGRSYLFILNRGGDQAASWNKHPCTCGNAKGAGCMWLSIRMQTSRVLLSKSINLQCLLIYLNSCRRQHQMWRFILDWSCLVECAQPSTH